MTSTDKGPVNLESILSALEEFKGKTMHLICFPENSVYFNFNKNLNKEHAATLDSPHWKVLQDKAKELGSYIHLGAMPLREGAQVFNSSVLISPEGGLQVVYRKIHLFDVTIEGREFRESNSLTAGEAPSVVDIFGWKVGMTICYDLRFSELFLHYHRQQVDLILVPSSFTVPTGRAHWATLLKARAIETQAFVVAAAQVGTHRSLTDPSLPAKETWGESLAFSPWGECLGRTPSFDEWQPGAKPVPLTVELARSLIQKSRSQIPLLYHRKLQ
jgi:predicted amidohydrolase